MPKIASTAPSRRARRRSSRAPGLPRSPVGDRTGGPRVERRDGIRPRRRPSSPLHDGTGARAGPRSSSARHGAEHCAPWPTRQRRAAVRAWSPPSSRPRRSAATYARCCASSRRLPAEPPLDGRRGDTRPRLPRHDALPDGVIEFPALYVSIFGTIPCERPSTMILIMSPPSPPSRLPRTSGSSSPRRSTRSGAVRGRAAAHRRTQVGLRSGRRAHRHRHRLPRHIDPRNWFQRQYATIALVACASRGPRCGLVPDVFTLLPLERARLVVRLSRRLRPHAVGSRRLDPVRGRRRTFSRGRGMGSSDVELQRPFGGVLLGARGAVMRARPRLVAVVIASRVVGQRSRAAGDLPYLVSGIGVVAVDRSVCLIWHYYAMRIPERSSRRRCNRPPVRWSAPSGC